MAQHIDEADSQRQHLILMQTAMEEKNKEVHELKSLLQKNMDEMDEFRRKFSTLLLINTEKIDQLEHQLAAKTQLSWRFSIPIPAKIDNSWKWKSDDFALPIHGYYGALELARSGSFFSWLRIDLLGDASRYHQFNFYMRGSNQSIEGQYEVTLQVGDDDSSTSSLIRKTSCFVLDSHTSEAYNWEQRNYDYDSLTDFIETKNLKPNSRGFIKLTFELRELKIKIRSR